ncbi:transcriptional regulator with XRE-family HTH domain [Paenibacillus jamilae]|jgi:transcriptional regulator with XRE-family HTH domain|uniref:Transcriptional regulator n=2 Tax=Paenibacillus TaxID=44249 RepID=A0A222WHV1_9BACL|nr:MULTISPECIES: helix-turn-helix transcriptional regulator [Paenibacillus]MDP9678227.1 transcriptional regulator with XRE-family HTH domain [Paenibacillus jamilae]ASR45775.1 transcriptional regulator [Paenibacillus kribbensis]KAF6614407.1 helix-turn-helix transcriptional regulator [Paenibacillus sp. EKM101P]KAF6625491.1 helix-turn-helix transcriptional regulator [Paenibacillus sp. EKM10P]KAF6641731.1 helix-turn-helix transcriptional regulator [Paenibacillus sp. EKM11P]
MSTIGQRIRTIRKTNNLNQIKFANIIGISQGTLSELEQDKYRPSLDIIIAIKENFNSHIEWLIFGDTPISKNTIFNLAIEAQELELISLFRGLTKEDRDEIIDFIKLKIVRY